MLYRINVYPEYALRQQERRNVRMQGTLFGMLLGICALLIGGTLLSSYLLHERVRTLRESTLRLSNLVESSAAAQPEAQAAQSLAQLRGQRIDWTPKLAALTKLISPTIRLTQVEGRLQSRGTPASFRLTGTVAEQSSQLAQVSQLMGALTEERLITQELPYVQLGTLKGNDDGRFQITCTASEEGR